MNVTRLAVDVQSGDYGPQVLISGLIDARKRSEEPFSTVLCGKRPEIEQVFSKLEVSADSNDFTIEHCPGTVSIEDSRSSAWRKRSDSSAVRCVKMQQEGLVDASVSAGDTAILLGAAIFILGRSEGVPRPALAASLPTICNKPVLLLDVGANLNCRAEHLISFAEMGSQYMRSIFGLDSPAVGLLNIGKEPIKGTPVIGDVDKALQKNMSNYAGFVEGNHVLTGEVDVVVCDGFVGNVLLKACGSFHMLAAKVLENHRELLDVAKDNLAVLNPDNYGAVPFLGIRGTVLKAHGGSSVRAISNAVLTAIATVKKKLY